MKEKLKTLLLGTNVPMVAFSLYIMKVLVISPSYQESIIAAIVAGLYGFNIRYKPILNNKKIPDKTQAEIDEIKGMLGKLNLSNIGKPPRRF